MASNQKTAVGPERRLGRSAGRQPKSIAAIEKELCRISAQVMARRLADLMPVSLIKGCVETLLDGAKDDPAAATRLLQIIQKHTDCLAFLIEDLLVISRLESGQVALERRVVNLSPLVEHTLNDFKARAAEREVRLANEEPEDLRALADAERLQHVFYHLV